MNGTCGPCLIRHCNPNLSRPDSEKEREREMFIAQKESCANQTYYTDSFLSRMSPKPPNRKRRIAPTEMKSVPPRNTLKSSFALPEHAEEREMWNAHRQSCVLSCGFFKGSYWLFTQSQCPFVSQRGSLMCRGLDFYFAKIANRKRGERKKTRIGEELAITFDVNVIFSRFTRTIDTSLGKSN